MMVLKPNYLSFVLYFILLNQISITYGNKLLIISIPGLTYKYIFGEGRDRMIKIVSENAFSLDLKPVFPSVTLTNLQTQATGLSAEKHGIINDGTGSYSFRSQSGDKSLWDQFNSSLPLWTANEKANTKYKSVVIEWSGCGIQYSGHQIGDCINDHNWELSIANKTKLVDEYVNNGTHNLIMVGIHDIFRTARYYDNGTFVSNTGAKELFPHLLSTVLNAVKHQTNVIVMGTHGLTKISNNSAGVIKKVMDKYKTEVKCDGGHAVVYCYSTTCNGTGCEKVYKDLYDKIRNDSEANFDLYLRDMIPNHWEYKNNERTAPLIAVMRINGSKSEKDPQPYTPMVGWSPYDVKDMSGTFVGFGPLFRNGVSVDAMSNKDIYLISCKILGITSTCGQHEGLKDVACLLLKDETEECEQIKATTPHTFNSTFNSTNYLLSSKYRSLHGIPSDVGSAISKSTEEGSSKIAVGIAIFVVVMVVLVISSIVIYMKMKKRQE